MKRRFFLLAAPAIVAAPSLMRVSTLPQSLAYVEGQAFNFKAAAGTVTQATLNFAGIQTIIDNDLAPGKLYFIDTSRYKFSDGGKEMDWDEAKGHAPDGLNLRRIS